MIDLFGNEVAENQSIPVNIYADEIQNCVHSVTGEEWLYIGAVFEEVSKPILDDLKAVRYCKNLPGWEKFVDKNNSEIHWTNMKNDANKANIADRWLSYLYDDCVVSRRKFRFAILGINMTNLNLTEFADDQRFNSVYNRFFRTLVTKALGTYYSSGVVVNQIFHEEGQQVHHDYFSWHTNYRLARDLNIQSINKEIYYLPKSHIADERSNIIQLIDMLMGMFKDLHLGVNHDTYHQRKKTLLEHKFVQEVLEQRVIKVGYNPNSSFGYHNRFSISLFPSTSTDIEDSERSKDCFYNLNTEPLSYYKAFDTISLF